MDGGENPVDTLLQNFNYLREVLFSEQTLHLLNTHLLGPSSTFQSLKRMALNTMAPILDPLLARLDAILTNSPDIVVLFVLVLVLVLVVQVLAWVRRVMLWITGLVFRALFWAAVVAGLAFVWQRGPEQTVRDVVVVVSKVAGYGAALRDVWLSEYRRYEAQETQGHGGRGR